MNVDCHFKDVFDSLKVLLLPYAAEMDVVIDNDSELFINTYFIMKNKKPLFFGSIKINKNYVSYHLMPVYVSPNLLCDISSGLKKSMQGKSCFNFKKVNDNLIKELAELTKVGYESYQKDGYL